MRPVTIHSMGQIKDPVVKAAVEEFQRASQENDIAIIATNFTITGAFTDTRTLDVTSATLADVRAFIATLITDLKKGGATRTT